ncbi:MAG: hypothetical protein RR341_08415, partial [Bacteroidales bacterium]
MKRIFKRAAFIVAVMTAVGVVSCKNNDDSLLQDGTLSSNGQTIDLGDGSNSYEINSNITLSYPNTYNLKGFVYVTSGNTLTIEPGVIIKGDKESKG